VTYLITCRPWQESDLPNLLSYLHHLNEKTRDRFGPHLFTHEALQHLYHHPEYTGFLIIENNSTFIIGYAIIKLGCIEHDIPRLSSYHINPNPLTDATYAPSIADDWQGKGIGKLLWKTVRNYLQQHQKKRVILWGGVQADNHIAVNYYHKNGFVTIGQYEYNGKQNMDMLCII